MAMIWWNPLSWPEWLRWAAVAVIAVGAFLIWHGRAVTDVTDRAYAAGWEAHAAQGRAQIDLQRAALNAERAALEAAGVKQAQDLEDAKAALAAVTDQLEQEARDAASTNPSCAPSDRSISVWNRAIVGANGAAGGPSP